MWSEQTGIFAAVVLGVGVVSVFVVYIRRRKARGNVTANTIDFEFGETVASNAFWDRNPNSLPAFMRLLQLSNKCFAREKRFKNKAEHLCYELGETCRRDFLEITFLAVNGHGIGAQKLLRGLYERAVTLEYIRQNPEKADRFIKFSAIQDHKVAKVAVGLLGEDAFNAVMTTHFADIKKTYEESKAEFEVSDCKKCGTKMTAFSWDIDVASMVKKLGEPYTGQYLTAYAMPTLHIHATLASAFSHQAVNGTPEDRNLHEAEISLISATFVFIAAIQSQSEMFSLNLDQETKACWDEVSTVWKDRPHGPSAKRAAQQQA